MEKNNVNFTELSKDLESSHVKKDEEVSDVKLDNEDIYNKETEPVDAEEVKEVVVEEIQRDIEDAVNQVADPEEDPAMVQVTESLDNIFNLLDSLNEEVNAEISEVKLDTEDVYPSDEHIEEKEVENPEVDTKDIYNKETEPTKKEEVEEVIVKEETEIKNPELDNEDIYNNESEPVKDEEVEEEQNIDTKDIFPADEHKEKTEVEEVIVKEEEEIKNPELDNADIYNKESEPVKTEEVKDVKLDTEDVYPSDEHKEKDEVKEIIVKEAVDVRSLTNFDILSLLEEAGLEASLENLARVKSGDIEIKEKPEEEKEEVSLDDNHLEHAENVDNKTVHAEIEIAKDIPAALKKDDKYEFLKNRFSEKTAGLLESFLNEDCGGRNIYLTEEVRTQTVKELAIEILHSISDKLESIDTTCADRSKGDIKQLRELSSIQEAITKLEELISRSGEVIPEAREYVASVIKSILFINQYSNVFKEAYRNKKVLLIMKYQSLILSIISSVSYLISALVDFSAGVALKKSVSIEKIAPLKTLEDFNRSVETGEFKIITRDITVLREYYTEVSVENLSKLYEAVDYLPMIIDTVKSLAGAVANNGKVANLVYKATGAIVLLFSLRDVFYSLFRMKSRMSDIIGNIQGFANINLGGSLSKLSNFANAFKVDAENSTEMVNREINDENRKFLSQVKNIQVDTIRNREYVPAEATSNEPSGLDSGDFSFDF